MSMFKFLFIKLRSLPNRWAKNQTITNSYRCLKIKLILIGAFGIWLEKSNNFSLLDYNLFHIFRESNMVADHLTNIGFSR